MRHCVHYPGWRIPYSPKRVGGGGQNTLVFSCLCVYVCVCVCMCVCVSSKSRNSCNSKICLLFSEILNSCNLKISVIHLKYCNKLAILDHLRVSIYKNPARPPALGSPTLKILFFYKQFFKQSFFAIFSRTRNYLWLKFHI